MIGNAWRRATTSAVLLVLALAVSACLLTPGKFVSTLDLRKGGQFAFTYTGEIHLLTLSKLAQMGNQEKVISPDPCFNDEGKERPCTASELAEHKRVLAEEQRAAAEKHQKDAEEMKAMLGGIDPSNPKAAEELAARLRKQAGWKSVVYKGDGLFDVDFAITGRLDHDFSFPTIERFPMANAFVQISKRNDGTVRMDAPGFSSTSGAGNPYAALMAGELAAKESGPAMPTFEGTFTLTTDGAILANNTDDGPQAVPSGQKLSWSVNVRNSAPSALVRLGN